MVQDEGPCQLLSYIAVTDMTGFIAIEFLRNIPVWINPINML